MEKIDKRKKPRWLECLKAVSRGYFWSPCPICGEYFGGHEVAGDMYAGGGSGWAVCANCAKEGKKIGNENWKKEGVTQIDGKVI